MWHNISDSSCSTTASHIVTNVFPPPHLYTQSTARGQHYLKSASMNSLVLDSTHMMCEFMIHFFFSMPHSIRLRQSSRLALLWRMTLSPLERRIFCFSIGSTVPRVRVCLTGSVFVLPSCLVMRISLYIWWPLACPLWEMATYLFNWVS